MVPLLAELQEFFSGWVGALRCSIQIIEAEYDMRSAEFRSGLTRAK